MHIATSPMRLIEDAPILPQPESDSVILTRDDIRHVVRETGIDALMDEMIARLTAALQTFRLEDATIPPRQGFRYSEPAPGLIEWMPCMYNGGRQATIKIVGYHPENTVTRNLPTILSTVSAYDTYSGHLICMMDGTLITALRTGATSAVASRIMASDRTTSLGLIGGGAQAVTQLHALSRVLDLTHVMIYDVDPARQASFLRRAGEVSKHLKIEPVSLERIVESSDVLCTVTSVGIGEGPVFNGIEPVPWAHINAVGSDFPGKTELPLDLLRRSFVCPDFREQAVMEGECQQLASNEIGPSLVELVQAPDQYGYAKEQLSVFDSTGWALEDHVAINLFMELAASLDVGARMPIELISSDVLNPYQL